MFSGEDDVCAVAVAPKLFGLGSLSAGSGAYATVTPSVLVVSVLMLVLIGTSPRT
jgi:hypothetical protein